MVRTIRLASLTLLAEPKLAVTLDGKGSALRRILRRKESITHIVRRRAGRCKDSGSVAPVEHDVKYNAYYRRTGAYPTAFPAGITNTHNHPNRP